MGWADVYLVCFLAGLVLSVVSLLIGVLDIPVPGFDGHAAADLGGDVGDLGHGPAHAGGLHVSPLNFATVMAFLAWFGGTGYLLTRFSGLWSLVALGLAVGAGFVGAALVFWVLVKVFVSHDHTMHAADYRVEGALATVIAAIEAGRSGEIVFSQGGARRAAGARSADGGAIAVGTEVVVTRYEDGMATVRRWEDLAGEPGHPAAGEVTSE